MEKEVLNFASNMQNQLDNNTILKTDNWRDFTNIKNILFELEYHKSKLYLAIKEKNILAIKEYLADCGNILMFLGNSFSLYDTFEETDICIEMKTDLFNEVNKEETKLKKF